MFGPEIPTYPIERMFLFFFCLFFSYIRKTSKTFKVHFRQNLRNIRERLKFYSTFRVKLSRENCSLSKEIASFLFKTIFVRERFIKYGLIKNKNIPWGCVVKGTLGILAPQQAPGVMFNVLGI